MPNSDTRTSAKSADAAAKPVLKKTKHGSDELWYCREYWCGDSRDGQYTNGDGYHYFAMKGDGIVLHAFEYYETDDGEEHSQELPELVGINWFDFFGFDDDELLEAVPEHEFSYVQQLVKQ